MQLALTYDAAHVGADDWSEVLTWLRRAVDVIGHKEVAYKLDVQPSQLTDALLERERKDVKAKWLTTILHLAPSGMVAEFLLILLKQHGYEAPRKRKPRTAEESNRASRTWLKEHAPAVLEMMDRELGE